MFGSTSPCYTPEPSPNSAVAPAANRCFTVSRQPTSSRAVRAGEPRAVSRRNGREITNMSIARIALVGVLLFALAGCRHDWREAPDFSANVRCGMREAEILNLAKQYGVDHPERVWWKQTSGVFTIKPGELDFVDVLFQNGQAVAVQRGNFVAFTTGMEFGSIRMVCGAAPIRERTLRDFSRNAG